MSRDDSLSGNTATGIWFWSGNGGCARRKWQSKDTVIFVDLFNMGIFCFIFSSYCEISVLFLDRTIV